jgi:hypothetical protein
MRFSARGVKKKRRNVLGKIHVKNFYFYNKNQGFVSRFFGVSLHEELKNTIKRFKT